jgi:nicotinamidase-related amidase
MTFIPAERDALIVTDVQNDFLPGGSLAIPESDAIVPLINGLAPRFATVVTTQDSHPAGHVSFIEQGGPWPVHCVEGSHGWELHPDLKISPDFQVFKGRDLDRDSYTAWTTELGAFLAQRGVERVVLVGLALDYCVKFTALDARAAGMDTIVLTDTTRAVEANPGDGDRALDELRQAGVKEDTAA